MEAVSSPNTQRFANILSQKLERSLTNVKEANVARESFYQCAETYRNRMQQPHDLKIDAFLHDCQHKTLHEVVNKHFNKNSSRFEQQHPLLKLFAEQTGHLENALRDETKNLSQSIGEQSNWAPILRHEMLRLVAYIRKNKCEFMSREPFNCHVINIAELPEYLDILNEMQAANVGCRLQLIVCNEVHYTAIDLEISPEEKICCILDAYRESKAALVEKAFLDAGFISFVVGRDNDDIDQQVQTDTRSCSIYSMSQLVSTAKIPNFLQRLKEGRAGIPGKSVNVSWTELPANIIKNSQNCQLLQEYIEKHDSDDVDLEYYFNKRGRGIESKLADYNVKVRNFISGAPQEMITSIVCESPLEALKQLSNSKRLETSSSP